MGSDEMPGFIQTQSGAKPSTGAPAGCTVAVWRYDGWSAVVLRGELDVHSAREVRAAVAEELADCRRVIVELVGLEFSDIKGLRTLGELAHKAESCRGGGSVELHGARDHVARLARMIGLEDVAVSSYAGH
jgi:anti-anti-sigma factor